ncbi:DUF4347 domain-containing protein, partial [Bradyrhizobium tropiciagri]|uniref:DUF4347 domain-containing protein n=1 Tax=Bradyrhizobium tropiciagri TaxID=312253 RepID=UPI001009DF71
MQDSIMIAQSKVASASPNTSVAIAKFGLNHCQCGAFAGASSKREIAFIDRGIDDLETLLAGIRSDVEAILLSNNEPAPRQMARALKGRRGLEAIHVIAHGTPGEVSFAGGALTKEGVQASGRDLARIGLALAPDGQIALWACHVANEDAQASDLVMCLAAACGVRVAASRGKVGHASKGGVWHLDSAAPPITDHAIRTYQGVLDSGNGTTVDNLNVLDAIKTNDTNGVEYIYWGDISTFLTTSANATQTVTIQQAFQAGQLLLTFQVGSNYYTIGYNSAASVYYQGTLATGFFLEQTDQYGTPVGHFDAITGQTVSGSPQTLISGFTGAISNFVSQINNLGLFASTTQLITDTIDGSAGKDNIQGIASNAAIHNIIQGGAGADVLTGGIGSDYFVYARATDSPAAGQLNSGGQLAQTWDQITNFQVGSDKLDFSQLISDQSVSSAGGVTAFAAGLAEFRWFGPQPANTGSMGPANGYGVWYTPDGSGGVYVYADTNGDGVADLKFDVAGVTALNPSDFVAVDPPSAFAVHIDPIEPTQSNPWLINLADASAPITVTGTVTHFTPSAHLIINLNGHSYTATVAANGTWSAVIPAGDLAHASLPDGTYTLSAVVKVGSSTAASDSHSVTVDETPPTVTWGASTPGVEGTAIHLGTLAASDAAGIVSLMVSAIPVGATLTDGTHTFTATSGLTSVDVHTWNLSTLTITPPNDTNFSLAAVATDGSGNSNTAVLEALTVNPLAATLAPVAASGVEGSAIALNVGLTLNKLAGDAAGTNTLNSLVISAIPVGATLADGNGHSFTATSGHTSVDLAGWNLGTLTVTPANDTNFVLNLAATEKDAEGNIGPLTTATEAVTVNPLAATLAPVAASGVEGSAIALNVGLTLNKLAGDAAGTNTLNSLVISAIPVGATLADGNGHSFTATSGHTSVDLAGWNLGTLTVTAANDTNFVLNLAATEKDAESNIGPLTTATEAVTVNPLAATLAPVAASGVEGSAIAFNVGLTLNKLVGDAAGTNTLNSLVISAIPVGATLADGNGHSFTASAGQTSVDVAGWTLGSLTVSPVNDTNFTLTLAATEKDAEGNIGPVTNATEAVTVNPLAATLAPVAASGVEGSAIALNVGLTLNKLAGDAAGTNTLNSLVISGATAGAVLSDGTVAHTYTFGGPSNSVDVHAWNLSSLTIQPANDSNFVLNLAAIEKDAEGNIGPVTNATEAVTVNPLAPTLNPVDSVGNENSAIAVDLGAVVSGFSGDHNSFALLVIGGIPVGATLSDGAGGHSFTAVTGATSADVSGWSLSNLKITPPTEFEGQFTLSVTATEKDGEGNLSSSTLNSVH